MHACAAMLRVPRRGLWAKTRPAMSTGTASAAVAADTATAHDAEPTTPTTTPSIGDPAAAAAAAAALEFMGDLDEAAILALLGRRASLRHVKIKGMPPLLYFCAMFDEEMALRVLVGPLAVTLQPPPLWRRATILGSRRGSCLLLCVPVSPL